MTLANRLTLGRLILAPVYFILFWIDTSFTDPNLSLGINLFLVILVTLAEISDALDGKIARGRNEVTDFGKLFDPFADYVTRFTFFFCFWWVGLFPAWMVVIIFYREAIISFLRLVVRDHVVLAARKTGKIKAIFQAVAIFIILAARIISYWIPSFPVRAVATSVMLIVVIVTAVSMVDYLYSCKDILKKIEK